MARYLGVDPGLTGGLALVETREGAPPAFVAGIRTPVMRNRGKSIIDVRHLLVWLTELGQIDQAVVEQVAARPGQGVTSVFTFGRATGAVEALALLMAETVIWVPPSTWKKDLGLSSDKRESLDLCKLRFGAAFTFTALADDGIAEAALLAYHAAGYR
jgi:crossover junction endodeoxyribonuclease RuvC